MKEELKTEFLEMFGEKKEGRKQAQFIKVIGRSILKRGEYGMALVILFLKYKNMRF